MKAVTTDVCLSVALLLATTIAAARAWADLPANAANPAAPAIALIALYVFVLALCIRRGRFDWVPGGRISRFVILLGMFLMLSYGLAFVGLTVDAKDNSRPDLRIRSAREADTAYGPVLGGDAPFWQLLQFVHSNNEAVRNQCRGRLLGWPDLDRKLADYLAGGWAEETTAFIADVYRAPPASLAPAYGRFLRSELQSWPIRLRGASQPELWEPNLRPIFRAAERIQNAGGDLKPQLREWAGYLRTVPALSGLSGDVERMIR